MRCRLTGDNLRESSRIRGSRMRLSKQMHFLNEVERLKVIYRRNRTVDQSRFENSAEHSWHVALMAMVLLEHAEDPSSIDILRVVQMLLIHDLVEVYAGDTWIYDQVAADTQDARETAAAEILFGILPDDQAENWRALWEEFEKKESSDARYAAAVDALQPLTNHLSANENSLRLEQNRPHRDEVLSRKRHIADASHSLWNYAKEVVKKSVAIGLYR